MLGPTLFVLPNGRQIAPFHIAPWFDRDEAKDLPGILQRLRGEWPCVPFGISSDRPAKNGWPASVAAGQVDPNPHGYSSNHQWDWLEAADALALSIDYPAPHPISRLERWVTPVPGRPALDFHLKIHVRTTCTLPIGLHPTFRLPGAPGAMQLEITATAAATFPGLVDTSSVFAQGQIIADWHKVPLADGGTLDPSRLPLQHRTEDLLQLLGTVGMASLRNHAENYRVTLEWNSEHLPDLLLWISNRGRRHTPWNGRHLALGVEPVCSAFDLGCDISTAPNPINKRGKPTAHAFHAGEVFETRYQISVDPLDAS
ncbi:MAG: hypothetical protein ABIV25_11420 [Paracoccaceae bacterium]